MTVTKRLNIKTWLILAALAATLTAAPARADTGNWISFLEVTGCPCYYGSFAPNATKFTVDPSGAQSAVGSSKSPITIRTGNQTQNVDVTFQVNGRPVSVATMTGSGQQDGDYFTSSPIDLDAGSNTITITVADPSHLLKSTVVTLVVPYHPVVLTNTSPPVATQTAPFSCTPGTWTADPTPTYSVTWESSLDGNTWSTSTVAPRYMRCKVVASNGLTATVYSAVVAAPAVLTVTTPAPTPVVTPPPAPTVSVATSNASLMTESVAKQTSVSKPTATKTPAALVKKRLKPRHHAKPKAKTRRR